MGNTQHMTTSPLMRTSVTTHHQMSPVMHSTYTKEHMAPKQFFMQDDFGNYHYGYATQDSERSEESNGQTVKGHYTYIMADGQRRRVDFIADNQGFHILRDDADITNRIKREAEAAVEPDLIRTRMTAVMDSTSLMDDNQDMYSANNMMGRDMTSMNNMMLNNQMSSDMYRSSDLTNLGSNLMGSDMYSNMMGHNISSNVMDKSMMGRQNMYTNMMGRVMSSNMMGRDMSSNMMGHNLDNNMMGHNMENNMMGRDMTSNMNGVDMTSNMVGQDMGSRMMGRDMNRMSPVNMMSQRMQIEQVPAESFNQYY